jgi:hypothetical protein
VPAAAPLQLVHHPLFDALDDEIDECLDPIGRDGRRALCAAVTPAHVM